MLKWVIGYFTSAHDGIRFGRFMPVGATAGIIDTSIWSSLLYHFGTDNAVWFGLMGAAVGYPMAFVGHRRLTFQTQAEPLWQQLGWFALYKSIPLAGRLGIFYVFLTRLQEYRGLFLLLLGIGVSFVLQRWIFAGEPPWRWRKAA